MFDLHDIIICRNARRLPKDRLGSPLIKGAEYQVVGLKACSCGAIFVDVGLILDPARFEILCGCQRVYADGTWWFDARRFVSKTVAVEHFMEKSFKWSERIVLN